MRYKIILIFIFALIAKSLAHDSEKDHPISYSFKDKIHGMCSGHYHLDDNQLKEICNHFPEHFSDILELQSKPPKLRPERYIQKMTVLVIFSDTLTKKQKHEFYRQSYNLAIEARKNGDEWKWLMGLLVEKTDALTLDELQDLMRTTSHEPLKPLIQKAIDRIEKRANNRPSVESAVKLESMNNISTNQPSSNDEHSNRYYWFISGLFLFGAIVFILKVLKRKST